MKKVIIALAALTLTASAFATPKKPRCPVANSAGVMLCEPVSDL